MPARTPKSGQSQGFCAASSAQLGSFPPQSDSPYRAIFPTQDAIEGIKEADIHLLNSRHLGNIEIPQGITYIKSPKGSGKTELLRQVVSDPHKSVLLIGHRRALIRQLCERLNLSCYLDEGKDGIPIDHKRYGVCLDSLSKARDFPYDYVLIDKSEQVLSHFLSDTMEDKRSSLIYRLRHHVAKAKRLVALDADLGWTTFRFFNSCGRSADVSKSAAVFLNEHVSAKIPLKVFNSKAHLVGEIHSAVARGERCYVTSNSRALIKSLFETLSIEVGTEEIIQITSKNSQSVEIQEFLSNIKDHARNYRVILTSPSVSTGVEISFEDEEQVFDHVFGIFEPKITTHFECDQQLLRVRNPKAVSVFISPSRYGFETNLDVVKADLLVERLLETLIDGYTDNGSYVFRDHHPLLDLGCSVVSVERASKNNLKQNFIDFKLRQNYPIEIIPVDPLMSDRGKDYLQSGKDKVDDKYVRRLMNARQLSRDELTIVREQVERNGVVPDSIMAAYDRTWIEIFYRQTITPALIYLHEKGRFQATVGRFEGFTRPSDVKMTTWVLQTTDFKDPFHKVIHSNHFQILFLQKALVAAGLWDGSAFAWGKEIDTRDLTEFVKLVQELKPQYETQFGNEIYADLVQKPMSQLNAFLGLIGLKMKKLPKRIIVEGKRITRYEWDMESVSGMEEISNRRSSYPDPWVSPPFVQN